MPEPRRIDRCCRVIVVDVLIKYRSQREVERGVNTYSSPRLRVGFDAMAVDEIVSTKRTSCSVSGSSSPGEPVTHDMPPDVGREQRRPAVDMAKIKDAYITFVLQSHLYALKLGTWFGPRFVQNEEIVGALRCVCAARTPEQLEELTTDGVIEAVISMIMRYEESVLAQAQVKGDGDAVLEIQNMMFEFHAVMLQLHKEVGDPKNVDLVALCDELDQRGIDSSKVVVTSMTKLGLSERIIARRRRHKWLRTPEGKAYLRELLRRRHRHHQIDRERSRTARQAARLYADER